MSWTPSVKMGNCSVLSHSEALSSAHAFVIPAEPRSLRGIQTEAFAIDLPCMIDSERYHAKGPEKLVGPSIGKSFRWSNLDSIRILLPSLWDLLLLARGQRCQCPILLCERLPCWSCSGRWCCCRFGRGWSSKDAQGPCAGQGSKGFCEADVEQQDERNDWNSAFVVHLMDRFPLAAGPVPPTAPCHPLVL